MLEQPTDTGLRDIISGITVPFGKSGPFALSRCAVFDFCIAVVLVNSVDLATSHSKTEDQDGREYCKPSLGPDVSIIKKIL